MKFLVPPTQPFQAYEIVCLELESTRLYGEVIQVILPRQSCWVRPLMMAECPDPDWTTPDLYDLRQGADLVLPWQWFRPALDTEVIPLLIQLETLAEYPSTPSETDPSEDRRRLNRFVHQLWAWHSQPRE